MSEGGQLAPLPAPPLLLLLLLQQPSLPQAAAPGEWFVSGRPGCLVALTNFWLSDQLTRLALIFAFAELACGHKMKGKVSYGFVELLYGQLEGKVIAFCSTTSKRERS